MTVSETRPPRPLRLWPGVAIVVLQLAALYVPRLVAPSTMALFFGMMGSFTIGPLLLLIWWLGLSRARWADRLGGLVLLVVAHTAAYFLAEPSARMVALVPGIPWLCAAFVASLFFGRRGLTVAAVLVASLGWTLVRMDGVTGTIDADLAWRFGRTVEQRFMSSRAAAAPVAGERSAAEPSGVADWSGFRGPARDGVVFGTRIDIDWARNPPREIWRRPVGPGWGSFSLADGRLCTQEQRDENEVVVCYDAANGEPLWLHAYPARFWEPLGGAGPRATPTWHAGRLYALGATGVLSCLDAATGEPAWTRDLAQDSGARVPEWGFASSPLIVEAEGLVVVNAPGASDGRGVVAYDLASGEPRWRGQAPGQSYSSPHLASLDGVPQVVMLTGEGAFGLAPDGGAQLWKHEWPMGGGEASRVVQPAIVDGGAILIGTTFGLGTRRLAVTAGAGDPPADWSATEVYTATGLKPYYNDLVVHRGTAFGFDGNILAAIDVATGERAWKGGRYGNGQLLLLADQDLLLVVSERGELALVRALPERFEEVARMQALDGKTWNHPVVAGGVLYLRNAQEAAAYRLPPNSPAP